MNPDVIQLEDGWTRLKSDGIDRLEYYLDNGHVPEAMSDVGESSKSTRVFEPEQYSNLYTLVYKMSTQKQPFNWSEKLYVRYSESVSLYVQQKVLPALMGKKGVELLEELNRRWMNHKLYIKWMDKIFQYLDRYYVRVRSAEPVSTKGLNIFKSLIFDEISVETTKALLELINEEREGLAVPEKVLKTVVEMYIELGINSLTVYNRDFEEALLPATAAFYAKQSRAWFDSLDLPDYLMKAEESLKSEEDRVGRYLHQSSLSKLRGVSIMQLLQEPQKELLGKPTSVSQLLEQDRFDDLARLYRMFSLVDNGLGPVASAFRQFVTNKGSALVDSKEEQFRNMSRTEAVGDSSFVQSLIDLHGKYKEVVLQCFKSDTWFQKSLKEAFEVFVNRDFDKVSMAALMSSFCDKLLRKSSGDNVEESIVKLVDLFSFLSEKDDFAEIYRNQLAKRILSESSGSEEAEKSLIQKLKLKCGASFTSKLEGMITDLALASDMQREFKQVVQASGMQSSFELSVTVLTTGFWPSYSPADACLTKEMELGISLFRDFYAKRTQHRRLTWIHSLGTATVAARFAEGKRFDLVMNTYQALVLLCFNDKATLTVSQICEMTKLEEGLAKKLLATLIFSKFKVLLKSSQDERSIESSDVISVNESFAVSTRKVRIPAPVTGTEETHNKSKVEEDRSFSIEAAIVRVMKTKKVLQHQQLVAEVVEQLTLFKPNPKSIKQRIENLIEREFIERDPANPNLYKYLA